MSTRHAPSHASRGRRESTYTSQQGQRNSVSTAPRQRGDSGFPSNPKAFPCQAGPDPRFLQQPFREEGMDGAPGHPCLTGDMSVRFLESHRATRRLPCPRGGVGKACVLGVRKVREEGASLRLAERREVHTQGARDGGWGQVAGRILWRTQDHCPAPPMPSPQPHGRSRGEGTPGVWKPSKACFKFLPLRLGPLALTAGPQDPPFLTLVFLSLSPTLSLLPDPGLWSLLAPVPLPHCGSKMSFPSASLTEPPTLSQSCDWALHP